VISSKNLESCFRRLNRSRWLVAVVLVGLSSLSLQAQEKRRGIAGRGDFEDAPPPNSGAQPGATGPASVPKFELKPRTIPGATASLDPKLTSGAPFNTKSYAEMPPEDENAGPLVLDALSEFPEIYALFASPNDPGVKEREQRLKAFFDFVGANPNPRNWNPDALEQIAGPYRVTYAKLRQAHQKPDSVILMPFGAAGPRVYMKSCIEAVLAAGPLIYLDLARGDKNGAIEKFGDALRLSRDFQFRTTAAGGSVISVMHQAVAENLLPLLLNAKSLTAADLDKILEHLAEYRKGSINLLPEMIKTEYLNQIAVLDLITKPGGIEEISNQLRSSGLTKQADQAGLMKSFAAMFTPENMANYRTELASGYKKMLAAVDAVGSIDDIQKLGAELAKIQEDGLIAANRAIFDKKSIGEIVKKISASDPALADQLKVIESFNDKQLEDAIRQQVAITQKMDWKTLATRLLYYQNDQGMMEALTAIRRWYVTKKSVPKDKTLEEICKEAGLKGAPLDIFAGKPMAMIWTQFGPAVYSAAHDFKDDGGKVQLKTGDRGKAEVTGDYVMTLAILSDPAVVLQPGAAPGQAPGAPAGFGGQSGAQGGQSGAQGGAIRPPGSEGSGGRRGRAEGGTAIEP
jgi:hypothetical protein